VIYRFPKPVLDVRDIDGRTLILSGGLYELKGNHLQTVLKLDPDKISGGWQLSEKPYGLKVSNPDTLEVEGLVDSYGEVAELTEEHVKGIKSDCYSIFDDEEYKEILISNLSDKRVEIESPGSLDWFSDCILSRSDSYSNIQCFNFQLDLKWNLTLDDSNDASYFGPCEKVYEYKHMFIFYAGVINTSRRVIAIDKNSGGLLWEYKFEGILTSIHQFKELTCLAVSGKMRQLDSNSGCLVSEIDSGFEEALFQIFVRNENLLYFTSYISAQVTIFRSDNSEKLGVIDLPEPYSTNRLQLPICNGSGFYLPLCGKYPHQISTTYGLLSLKNDENLILNSSVLAELESKPDSEVIIQRQGDKEEYMLSLQEVDFDVFERYFEIYVLELASNIASQTFPSDHVNPKFNGKIFIEIPNKYSEGEVRRKLEKSVARLNQQLEYFSAASNDIEVSLLQSNA